MPPPPKNKKPKYFRFCILSSHVVCISIYLYVCIHMHCSEGVKIILYCAVQTHGVKCIHCHLHLVVKGGSLTTICSFSVALKLDTSWNWSYPMHSSQLRQSSMVKVQDYMQCQMNSSKWRALNSSSGKFVEVLLYFCLSQITLFFHVCVCMCWGVVGVHSWPVYILCLSISVSGQHTHACMQLHTHARTHARTHPHTHTFSYACLHCMLKLCRPVLWMYALSWSLVFTLQPWPTQMNLCGRSGDALSMTGTVSGKSWSTWG